MSNRSGKSRYPHLTPGLIGKASSYLPFMVMLAVSFQTPFIVLEKLSSISNLLSGLFVCCLFVCLKSGKGADFV